MPEVTILPGKGSLEYLFVHYMVTLESGYQSRLYKLVAGALFLVVLAGAVWGVSLYISDLPGWFPILNYVFSGVALLFLIPTLVLFPRCLESPSRLQLPDRPLKVGEQYEVQFILPRNVSRNEVEIKCTCVEVVPKSGSVPELNVLYEQTWTGDELDFTRESRDRYQISWLLEIPEDLPGTEKEGVHWKLNVTVERFGRDQYDDFNLPVESNSSDTNE